MAWSDVITKAQMSNTAMRMYLRCPKQFEYRYIQNLKQPPNLKFSLGKAFHKGTEHNYRQKFKSKRDEAIKTMKAVFADSYKKIVKEDKPPEGKLEIGRTQDLGIRMTEVYHRQTAPKFQPLIVPETSFLLKVPGARRPMVGYIDLLAAFTTPLRRIKRFLTDTKTSRVPYNQIQADTDIQLTIYSAGVKQLTGSLPDRVGFDVMVKNVEPKPQILFSNRNIKHVERLYEQYRGVERGIDAGAFPPVDDAKTCSWCGYRNICHKGRGWT